LLHVSAHDHYSDIRYSFDETRPVGKQVFYNLLISPGLTPRSASNPGVAYFDIDPITYVPHSLKMSFLDLN
jgi:hypothetical protein